MLLNFAIILCFASTVAVTLTDDPSLWPGHLESFGSQQKTSNVEVLSEWPSPSDFFKEFIDKSRPALFKGLAKRSPAFQLWNDDYLKNHQGSDSYLVYVEPEKKENRTKEGKEVTFKKFIEIYHNESIYMVHGVPKIIQKDVLMPAPLRCEETKKLLLDAVTWFSSGGTKSVVHLDDLDNVNCLIKGSKTLFFVNYQKYGSYLSLKNGYSSIDVEKVNYTKHPNLRGVEYIRADMEEGDCLFIPFEWVHQVNSKANKDGQNIAVNIWFTHKNNHQPKTCDISPEEATLDKYWFPELEKTQARMEDRDYQEGFLEISSKYETYLKSTKKKRANFKTFYSILSNDDELFGTDVPKENLSELKETAKKLFTALDITKNGIFNENDYDYAEENNMLKEYEVAVTTAHTDLMNIVRRFQENEIMKGEENPHSGLENKINDEL